MSARPLRPGQLPGVAVEPRDGESADHLVRRFARLVDRCDVLSDLRRRRWFRTRREVGYAKRHLATRRERRRERVR